MYYSGNACGTRTSFRGCSDFDDKPRPPWINISRQNTLLNDCTAKMSLRLLDRNWGKFFCCSIMVSYQYFYW